MTRLEIKQQFNSIQNDLLGLFKSLRYLSINEDTFNRLVRRQGISWLASINADIRVKNMSNSSELARYAERYVVVAMDTYENSYKIKEMIRFDDKDFCLYKVINKQFLLYKSGMVYLMIINYLSFLFLFSGFSFASNGFHRHIY